MNRSFPFRPSGPGGSGVRGYDPQPEDSVAQRILMRLSVEAARGAFPAIELIPTDSVVLNDQVVGAGVTTNGVTFQFPCDGVLTGIRLTACDSSTGVDVNQNAVLCRIQIDGNTELFPSATGIGAGFLPFGQASGNAASSSAGRYPIRVEFKQTNFWAVYLTNRLAASVACDITFDIIRTTNVRSGSM
jgi:hypothetical protein